MQGHGATLTCDELAGMVEVHLVQLTEARRVGVARHVSVTETLEDRGGAKHPVGNRFLVRVCVGVATHECQEVQHLLGLCTAPAVRHSLSVCRLGSTQARHAQNHIRQRGNDDCTVTQVCTEPHLERLSCTGLSCDDDGLLHPQCQCWSDHLAWLATVCTPGRTTPLEEPTGRPAVLASTWRQGSRHEVATCCGRSCVCTPAWSHPSTHSPGHRQACNPTHTVLHQWTVPVRANSAGANACSRCLTGIGSLRLTATSVGPQRL